MEVRRTHDDGFDPVIFDLPLAGLVAAAYGHLPDVARAKGLPLHPTELTFLLLLGLVAVRVLATRRAAARGGPPVRAARRAVTAGVPRAVVPLLAYGLVVVAGVLYAQDPAASVDAAKNLAISIVLLLTTMLLITSRRSLRTAAWAIVLTALGLCAVNVLQYVSGRYSNDFLGLARSVGPVLAGGAPSIGGPFGDPNYFAQRLVVAVPLAIWLARTSSSWILRLGAAGTAGACGLTIALSGSRGGMIALVVVAGGVLHGLVPRERRAIGWVLSVVAFGLLLVPVRTRERVASVPGAVAALASDDDDPAGRLREWRVAVAMYSDHPLFGVGAGNFKVRYLEYADATGADLRPQERTPHNAILEAAAETGILGAAAFGAIVVNAFASLGRARRRRGESAATPGLIQAFRVALVGYGVAALFLGLVYTDLLWVLLGIAYGCSQIGAATTGAPPRPATLAETSP